MRERTGYTLTEILVVIVILAVLASIVVPRMLPQTEKANAAEGAGMLGAIRQGEMAYRLDTGSYLSPGSDADWGKLGLDNPNNLATRKFDYAVDGASGTATATRVASGGTYAGNTITLTITGTWGGTHPYHPT